MDALPSVLLPSALLLENPAHASILKMSDVTSLLPASVLRNLCDKLYEKRKNAALEVEGIIRQLSASGDHERIATIINALINDFALSPQANHRKGGLIGLAAATVGLAGDSAQHLEQIVPPVLKSLVDQDHRVRYYACEALYNIAKVARGDFILFFNQIFDALCKLSADSDASVQSAAHLLDRLVKDIVTESDQFSIEEFIPLLRERMNVLNPYVRQFLVGWITVLDSVPDIDMLGFLPDFLDGLFNMLSDTSYEIRQQADSALFEFLQEIKNSPSVDYGRMAQILVQRAGSVDAFTRQTAITWINEFVKLGHEQLATYYAEIIGSILPCISDEEEKIRAVAKDTNEKLQTCKTEPHNFDIEAVLKIAQRELKNRHVETRLQALQWIFVLLEGHRIEVLSHLQSFAPLLDSLADTSDEVVLLLLDIFTCIAKDEQQFHPFMVSLVDRFHTDQALLEKQGTLIIRRLCALLNAENIYRKFADILEEEEDLNFVTTMVQALNLILLTASELAKLRSLLKQSLSDTDSHQFFIELYKTWSCSPMATISLCLLGQAYQHAVMVIQSLGEEDINVKFLVQVDKLVRLLETPIFTYLRLQLLDPGRYSTLIRALNGLLMLLPQQSVAFKILRTRLKTVPAYALMHVSSGSSSEFPGLAFQRMASDKQCTQILSHSLAEVADNGVESSELTNCDFHAKLQLFRGVQNQHGEHRSSHQNLKLKKEKLELSQGGDQEEVDFYDINLNPAA